MRRASVHGPLLAAFLGTAMVLCAVALTIAGLVDSAADQGARAVASRHAGADLALGVSLELAEDPAAQDSQVRAALARSLAGLAMAGPVDRTVVSDATLRVLGGGAPGQKRSVAVMSVPDLPARARLVAGSWAADADDVVVQADAAAELGLRPGSRVALGAARFDVSGTWRARDHLDPRWLGDPQVGTGSADGQFGPVVLDASRWPALGTDARARWVVVPDLDHAGAADLHTVATVRDRFTQDWNGRVDQLDSLAVEGRLMDVVDEAALRTRGLRAVRPAVLIVLAAVGLVALAALARHYVSTSSDELSLLWARGASSHSLAGEAALETSAATVAGGIVGALAAIGVAHVRLRAESSPSTTATAIALVAVTLPTAALTAGQVLLSTGRTSAAWRGPSGRAGRLIGPGLVALAVAAAALAVWQLRSYGSLVTVDGGGTLTVDPITVAAPAALVVAVVLLGLAVFPGLAAQAERRSDTEDVTRALAARHLSRRLVPVTAPVLVVAIAAATLTAAAAYAQTWADGFDRTRQLRAGADVSVASDGIGPDRAVLTRIEQVRGVSAVAPVAVELGSDIEALVAVSPPALSALGRGFTDDAERRRTVAAITSDAPMLELPRGTDRVRLDLEAVGLGGPPAVTLVLADASGALQQVPLELRGRGGRGTLAYAARLTPDRSGVDGPRTIAALDLDVDWRPPVHGRQPRVGLVGVTAAGSRVHAALVADSWTAHVPGGRELPAVPGRAASAGDVLVDQGVRQVRLTPSYVPGSPDGPRAPVVLSRTAADRLDLKVGDPVTLTINGTYDDLPSMVAGIVPAVPGAPAESAALVDLRAVEQARLNGQNVVPDPTNLWIAAGDPETTAREVRSVLPANSRIETATDAAARDALAATAEIWWWCAAGCGLLALLTLVTVARGQLRSRRGDAAVLRALGMSVREQQGLRGRELAWTTAFALVVGLIGGAAVAALVVTPLARTAVPEPYPTIGTRLDVDATGLVLGALLLLGALSAGIAWYVWRVGAELRSTTDRGGDR